MHTICLLRRLPFTKIPPEPQKITFITFPAEGTVVDPFFGMGSQDGSKVLIAT